MKAETDILSLPQFFLHNHIFLQINQGPGFEMGSVMPYFSSFKTLQKRRPTWEKFSLLKTGHLLLSLQNLYR